MGTLCRVCRHIIILLAHTTMTESTIISDRDAQITFTTNGIHLYHKFDKDIFLADSKKKLYYSNYVQMGSLLDASGRKNSPTMVKFAVLGVDLRKVAAGSGGKFSDDKISRSRDVVQYHVSLDISEEFGLSCKCNREMPNAPGISDEIRQITLLVQIFLTHVLIFSPFTGISDDSTVFSM